VASSGFDQITTAINAVKRPAGSAKKNFLDEASRRLIFVENALTVLARS